MLESIILQLHQIPFWAWVTVPTVLIAITTYFITRNFRHTLYIVLFAFTIGWATAAFHFWEQYLITHFMGEFDPFGLPSNFSRSGFALMLDAWVLWLAPALLTGIFVFTITYFVARHISPIKELALEQKSVSALDSKDVASQLEIQQLKRQITLLKQHLRSAKKGIPKSKEVQHDSNPEIKRLKSELSIMENKKQEQAKYVKILEDDVTGAKELIEKLLGERFQDDS